MTGRQEDLQRDLPAAYDALRATLDEAETALVALGLGVEASVSIFAGVTLVFGRRGGEWGLYVEEPGGRYVHLESVSVDRRIAAAAALGDLHACLLAAAREKLVDVQRATRQAKMFVAEITSGTATKP